MGEGVVSGERGTGDGEPEASPNFFSSATSSADKETLLVIYYELH